MRKVDSFDIPRSTDLADHWLSWFGMMRSWEVLPFLVIMWAEEWKGKVAVIPGMI